MGSVVTTTDELPTRLRDKIVVDDSGCWLWTAATDGKGYGAVKWDRRVACAHRLVFHLLCDDTLAVFPGRGKEQLDHLCRIHACVNPEHLESVTNRENTIRGRSGVLGAHVSPFLGVKRQGNRWEARLSVNGRRMYLGLFIDERDAAQAYDAAVAEHHGPDAPTNQSIGLLPEEEA